MNDTLSIEPDKALPHGTVLGMLIRAMAVTVTYVVVKMLA